MNAVPKNRVLVLYDCDMDEIHSTYSIPVAQYSDKQFEDLLEDLNEELAEFDFYITDEHIIECQNIEEVGSIIKNAIGQFRRDQYD